MRDLGSNIKLPRGWRFTRFDEFLKKIDRKTIIQDDVSYKCVGVRWYAMGTFVREHLLGMNIARKQQWIIRAGDVVYNKLFAWKGSFAIADDSVNGCIVSDKFPTYEVNLEIIHPDFLRYYFRTPQLAQQAQDLSKGAAAISKLTLNPPQFWDLIIPLPPLEEQRRIAAKIDKLAAKIEEARGLQQKSKADLEVIWPALLGFAYDEAKSTAARVERLGDLCCQITDGTHLTPTYVDDGVPFLSVKDITSGRISFQNVKHITPEEHAILTKRCKPERDDVLLTKVGTTGYAKAIDVDREFSIFVSLALLKLDKTRLLPKFTEHMLNSSRLKEYSKEGTRGVGNQNLVLKFIREFPVPVPPLEEQRRIVSYIDELQFKIEALRRAQAESAAELDALFPSILDKAFKGEL